MIYYSNLQGTSSEAAADQAISADQERENKDRSETELLRKFEKFVREANDNFYVINNSLKEKDREIQELKTSIFLAEEKIKTLQEALQRRLESSKEHEDRPYSFLGEKKTLLIGDSCLQEIKPSDLKEDTLIRTLPEANISLMKSWIMEKLDHPLKECIIYCGAQDILEAEDVILSETIFDGIGEIVAELKSKNEDVNIKICELVPSLKSAEYVNKINEFNSKLHGWCQDNGVVYIKTENYFKLGTGDTDGTCYNNKNSSSYDNLSRIGAVRLLDAIVSTCQGGIVRENWKETKWNSLKPNIGRKRSLTENVRKDETNYGNPNLRNNRNFRNGNNFRHSVPFRMQLGNNESDQDVPHSIRKGREI